MARKAVSNLEEELGRLSPIVKELQAFIDKEIDARKIYVREAAKLNKVEARGIKIAAETEERIKEAKEQESNLEKAKTYISDWSGRLTTRTREIREATDYLNKELSKKGVRVEYEQPPENITIIPF